METIHEYTRLRATETSDVDTIAADWVRDVLTSPDPAIFILPLARTFVQSALRRHDRDLEKIVTSPLQPGAPSQVTDDSHLPDGRGAHPGHDSQSTNGAPSQTPAGSHPGHGRDAVTAGLLADRDEFLASSRGVWCGSAYGYVKWPDVTLVHLEERRRVLERQIAGTKASLERVSLFERTLRQYNVDRIGNLPPQGWAEMRGVILDEEANGDTP